MIERHLCCQSCRRSSQKLINISLLVKACVGWHQKRGEPTKTWVGTEEISNFFAAQRYIGLADWKRSGLKTPYLLASGASLTTNNVSCRCYSRKYYVKESSFHLEYYHSKKIPWRKFVERKGFFQNLISFCLIQNSDESFLERNDKTKGEFRCGRCSRINREGADCIWMWRSGNYSDYRAYK